jgi:hypothetical protein
MYLSLNAFHFHIFTLRFLRSILFNQTWYSLFLCHSFLCLGSPYHPIANAKPTGFNTLPTALSKSYSQYQNIMTQLAYEHVNDSFLIHCNTKIEIISSIQSRTDHYPENQLVQSGVASNSSLVIFMFSKEFFPLDFCLAASNDLPRDPTQAFPT